MHIGYLLGLWSICTRLQVSWRKVLDLDKDDENAERDKDDEKAERDSLFDWQDDEAVPDRLLAAGPTDNQVIIFRREGCLTRIVKPSNHKGWYSKQWVGKSFRDHFQPTLAACKAA